MASEGSGAAIALQFKQARFNIIDIQGEIHSEKLTRRRVRATLIGIIGLEIAVVTALNLLRVPHNSPLRFDPAVLLVIDISAVLIGVVLIYFGVRRIAAHTETIADLRLRIKKIRENERDVRSKMPAESARRLLWAYHADVMATIEEYRDHALRYRKVHNRFQTLIIIGSLLTTAITTAAVKYSGLEWAAVVISFTVGVSAGMTGYFKFRERSINLQQAADELEHEYKAAELGIKPYRGKDEEDRLIEFAERAESIKDEQRKREQQLEQPPEAQSKSGNSAN